MDKIHVPEYFSIQELVPPDVYRDRGVKAWELLDARKLITLDQLRERFGPMMVNNWHLNNRPSWCPKLRQWSGLRTPEYYRRPFELFEDEVKQTLDMLKRFKASYSQHKYGRADDCIFRDILAEDVRQYIFANPDEFPFINSVELGTSWLHFDTRNCDRIKTYKP